MDTANYASGEAPATGDTIEHDPDFVNTCVPHKEHGEEWIVTSICLDMVRAKCSEAFTWRQAFYTKHMRLVNRKGQPRP